MSWGSTGASLRGIAPEDLHRISTSRAGHLHSPSQLVVALGGADHVLDTAGLTYAQYDDAVPALEAALPRLDPAVARQTVAAICAEPHEEDGVGLAEWNRSAVSAQEVRVRLGC